jgi:hypothetical protein
VIVLFVAFGERRDRRLTAYSRRQASREGLAIALATVTIASPSYYEG